MKPIVRKPHIEDGFHRDDFGIDTGTRTVTCPARHTTRIRPGGTAPFSKWCNGCPLRARCTTSKNGRTIKIDKHHDHRAANKTRWAKEETQNTYRNLRPSAERTIAWLTRHRARRVPYRGLAPNQQWLTTPTAAINPRTPHQPRTHPHHHQLGHQPRLEPQNPPAAPKEPRHRHQPTQNTHPTSPNRPHHTNTANSPNPIISRLLGHRGRKDDPLYRIRRLLTAAHDKISDRGQTRLRGLLDAGDPHGEVRTAWHAKETVRGIYGIDSPVLALRYTLQLADDLQHESCPPEINKLGRTIARWTPQITNWHISKVTNRCHRSPQQPHQTHQTSSVRVTQLRQLPNPGTALCGETQLGPIGHRHSPLNSDEPLWCLCHDLLTWPRLGDSLDRGAG